MKAHLIIGYGYGVSSFFWTGDAWAADVRLAYRYNRIERETLELPRGGMWCIAPETAPVVGA